MSDLYIKQNGEVYGPYTPEQVNNMYLPSETLIGPNPEGEEWYAISESGMQYEGMEDSYNKEKKEKAIKDIIFGALWCIGGIVVTIVTYNAASGGGTYVIAWGAILFGGIQLLKGLINYFS